MSKSIKFVLPTVAALGAFCYLYAPARLAALVLLGRSPVCPMARAIHSADELHMQIADKDRILYASKLLEKDPAGYHLWDTPHGRFWIPQGSDYVLPFNLAEQERKIYGVGEQDVHTGDVVLDCGANVGVYTREALKNGAKVVVSIEPAPKSNAEPAGAPFVSTPRARSVPGTPHIASVVPSPPPATRFAGASSPRSRIAPIGVP